MSDTKTKNKWSAFLTLMGLIQAPIIVLITQLMIGYGISTSMILSVTAIIAAGFIVLGNYVKTTYDVQTQVAQTTALKAQLAQTVVDKLNHEKEIEDLRKQCEELGAKPELQDV